ncbi:hypothetical protein CA54_03430 [Symmachiella macrocystis]|uniref:Lipoprotein n=1 Tax=Symmachiella macrocystis TaxID=2527985 RepID=A0A5C6BJR5_9PLAN|nr:hypothetical protein [Symmachiella macrocystis]TWU11536.1 hypothetical protein CA54_03430 [Symmachiella macrocystis]
MLRITLGGLLLCLAGCASGDQEQTSLTAQFEETVSKSLPMLACLHRLLDTPVAADAGIPQTPPDSLEILAIPTPEDLAQDGCRYTLHIDRAAQRAWVKTDGGIADHLHETTGPWPLMNADVKALMAELAKAEKKSRDEK